MTDVNDLYRRVGALETQVQVLRGVARLSTPDDDIHDVFWEDFPARFSLL